MKVTVSTHILVLKNGRVEHGEVGLIGPHVELIVCNLDQEHVLGDIALDSTCILNLVLGMIVQVVKKTPF